MRLCETVVFEKSRNTEGGKTAYFFMVLFFYGFMVACLTGEMQKRKRVVEHGNYEKTKIEIIHREPLSKGETLHFTGNE